MADHDRSSADGWTLHDSFERLLEVARDARRHDRFFDAPGLRGLSLTRGESFLLAEVVRRAPIRPSDLAAECGLDRSITSRQVDALVRVGLVERHADPSDGRATLLRPSRRGKSVLARLRAERERWLSAAVAELEPSEVHELTRILPRLVQAIERVDTA